MFPKLLVVFIFIFVQISCSNNNNNGWKTNDIKIINQNNYTKLKTKKIYFGHQSVGFNIINGIEMRLKGNPTMQLNIQKGNDLALFDQPVFAHDSNGLNRNPKSKIDDFYNTMQNGLGDKVDIAGFKFCYVDLEDGSDVEKIFDYYKLRMNDISSKYPDVKIIHFTVPLRSLQSGPKAMIKKIIGKDIGLKDNAVRQEFNELLLEEFKNQNIFDLAKIESTHPNGSREYTLINNKKIYSMVPKYTYDGGHLSKEGMNIIGNDFLLFLLNLNNGRIN